MPIRRKAKAPEPEPSFLDRIGGLPGLLAGGTRAITGVASAEGFLPGAIISGAGELGAEALEGSLFKQSPLRTLGRVGAAGITGAIPFGAVLKEGRPLASAARGALYSGGGEALREAAASDQVDIPTVAKSAATGGILTGGLSALMKMMGIGGTGVPGETKAPSVARAPFGPKSAKENAQDIVLQRSARLPNAAAKAAERYQDDFETALSRKIVRHDTARETAQAAQDAQSMKNVQAFIKDKQKAAERAAKQAENQNKLDKILTAVEEGKLKPGKPAISKSTSATTSEGERMGMRIPFKGEKKGGGEGIGADDAEDILNPSPAAPSNVPAWQASMGPQRAARGTQSAVQEQMARYDAWRKAGVPHEEAVANARAGMMPGEGPGQPPSMVPAPSGPAPNPSAPPSTAAEVTPSATYAYKDPISGLDYYHVVGGPSDKSTVSAAKLAEMGIPVPEGAVPVPVRPAQPVAPAEAPSSPLARFFKSRVEAAGQGYGDIKAAKAAGEKVPQEGYTIAGANAARERRAAGLPAPPRTPKVPPAAEYAPEELASFGEQAGKLDELAKLLKAQPQAPAEATADIATQAGKATAETAPGILSTVISKLKEMGYTPEQMAKMTPEQVNKIIKGEKGEVNPLLLARLSLGAGGALLGAATDPLGNRLASAVAGGAVGALAPSVIPMLRNMGVPPNTLEGLDQAVTSPEGIRDAAKRIYHNLPQIQRFNYLFSLHGLPANAVVGPYGSAVMGALEHGLSGDPRGWALLKSLNPITFAKEFNNSMAEAAKLLAEGEIGRAENVRVGAGAPLTSRVLSVPGHYMLAGDVTARKFLTRAGFSPEEARRITLTSEPELPAAKTLANLSKSSPLLNILAPFRRTPANIAEQGFERLPGIGSIVQSQREVPDPLKQQLVQQALSTAVGGASGALASQLDPETARIARRYVSNFGGQYSLPAAIGFAAGQAIEQGKPVISAQNISPAINALPLPSTQSLTDWAQFILNENHPLPAGAIPAVATDRFPTPSSPTILEYLGLSTPRASIPPLKGIPRIRRRR